VSVDFAFAAYDEPPLALPDSPSPTKRPLAFREWVVEDSWGAFQLWGEYLGRDACDRLVWFDPSPTDDLRHSLDLPVRRPTPEERQSAAAHVTVSFSAASCGGAR
jgi:hypothetical protein